MFDLAAYLSALAILLLAGGGWLYTLLTALPGPRTILIIVLVTVWAARLSGYLTWRNWGRPEDRRYREIRRRNEPGFACKSLYLVFALQAVLAWIIAAPLAAGIAGQAPLAWLDYVGMALSTFGVLFETIGDWQLARFKAQPETQDKVMDRGLWRYTRHPNYFGEACLWWGYWLIAVSAGGWWTVFAPLLMSVLLRQVSGVALLEHDIGARRPAYRDDIARTNAFFPGPCRAAAQEPL